MIALLDEIFSQAGKDFTIEQASVGFFTTGVVSVSPKGKKYCGLASTLKEGVCSGGLRAGLKLKGENTLNIATELVSGTGPEISLAFACLNSCLPEVNFLEINAQEIIETRGAGKKVAVIGHFPFVTRLYEIASVLKVSELSPKSEKDITAQEMEKFLGEVDVIALTALTLMNGTFEKIISSCRRDSFKVLLGPSAPMHPSLLNYVDCVCGTFVCDPSLLLSDLSEGKSFRLLRGKKAVAIGRIS
ncbi:MAG: DUF364 domain-containing protein [Elusimicrobia bacterium]|nr:DUF364 domain-containing protein [Elusimicrobiota bacterium]